MENTQENMVTTEVSRKVTLMEKMQAVYGGLGRSRVGEGYHYKIFEEKMPDNNSLREYFLAKADYLKDLMKSQVDFERKRQLEQAEDRTRLAYETLSGVVNRNDLVVSEIVGLQMMCDKYEVFPETKTGIGEQIKAESDYFKKLAETVAQRLGTSVVEEVRGSIDTEIYPVDFVGMLMPYPGDEFVEDK